MGQNLIIVPLHSLSLSTFRKQKPSVLAGPLAPQLDSKLHRLAPTWALPGDSAGQWNGIRLDVSSHLLQDEAAWWGFLVPALRVEGQPGPSGGGRFLRRWWAGHSWGLGVSVTLGHEAS